MWPVSAFSSSGPKVKRIASIQSSVCLGAFCLMKSKVWNDYILTEA